jgi:molybdopterin converting factor small subunit
MSVTVLVPAPLRAYAGDRAEVVVDGVTAGEVLAQLTDAYPRLRLHLYTDSGALRGFVNVFLNDEDIRVLGGFDAAVRPGDTILILPSIAGGRRGRGRRGRRRVRLSGHP